MTTIVNPTDLHLLMMTCIAADDTRLFPQLKISSFTCKHSFVFLAAHADGCLSCITHYLPSVHLAETQSTV